MKDTMREAHRQAASAIRYCLNVRARRTLFAGDDDRAEEAAFLAVLSELAEWHDRAWQAPEPASCEVSPAGYIAGVDYGACSGGCVPGHPCWQRQGRHWFDNPANAEYVEFARTGHDPPRNRNYAVAVRVGLPLRPDEVPCLCQGVDLPHPTRLCDAIAKQTAAVVGRCAVITAWLQWAFHRVGYVVRPYDMLADARRWFWQPRQRCGWPGLRDGGEHR